MIRSRVFLSVIPSSFLYRHRNPALFRAVLRLNRVGAIVFPIGQFHRSLLLIPGPRRRVGRIRRDVPLLGLLNDAGN